MYNLCVHVCVQACCTYVWRPEVSVGWLPQLHSTLYFETESLCEHGAPWPASTSWEMPWSLPPQPRDCSCSPPCPWVLERKSRSSWAHSKYFTELTSTLFTYLFWSFRCSVNLDRKYRKFQNIVSSPSASISSIHSFQQTNLHWYIASTHSLSLRLVLTHSYSLSGFGQMHSDTQPAF